MAVSVTHLATYLYCKRKLWLQTVLRLREPPKAALIKGSVRHTIHELLNKEEHSIVSSIRQPEYHHIRQQYITAYKPITATTIEKNASRLAAFNINLDRFTKDVWTIVVEEAENRATNVHNFVAKHNVFGPELWEKLTPKIESEVKITSKNLSLRGIVDQILQYPDGPVPIELKTGKSPKEGAWPGHKLQLGAYALLLEEHHQKPVKEGFIHYLDTQEKRHIPINAFLRQEIKDTVSSVKTLLTIKDPPLRTTNQNKCAACGLKKQCYNDAFITNKVRLLKQTTLG